jgi:uncharacterized protein YciI
MTECWLVLGRAADDAGARIGAVREAHLALLHPMAEAGELILGVPLLDEAGANRGSLMLVAAGALDRYLEAEPFRREGIWADHVVHPFRVAPLPYHPLPGGPASPVPTHSIAIAHDGMDPDAPARRLLVREAHLDRVRPAAEDGTLALGGAILDAPGGRMIGSVALTAHPTIAAAQAWWGVDPYVTGGVWRKVAWHSTRIAPLPYRSLPGAAGS